MDLVSIIVPVYKVEQYLHECVDSILAQTYKNIEVILVDDGSPDASPQICDEYAAKDPRVRVIHKPNGGLSDARNAGLDVARGEYINFCDSDDKIDLEMIETLVELSKRYCIDIIECESVFYYGDREEIIPHYHKNRETTHFSVQEFMAGLLLIKADCSVCNKLFRRVQINKFRFAVGKNNEDILFLFDVLATCKSILHINKGFYKYRINPNSITHVFNERSLDAFYNTLSIRKLIYNNYPEIKGDADKRLIKVSWEFLAILHGIKERFIEPYSNVYKQSKRILISNIGKIIICSDYKIISKLGLIYRLMT